MKAKNLKIRKKGLTLIEILLVGTVASQIFICVILFMMTSANADIKRSQQELFEMTKNDLRNEFTTNLRWATDIKVNGSEKKITVTLPSKTVEYKLHGHTIEKDGESLTSSNINISDFQAVDYTAKPEFASLEITVNIQNAQYPSVTDKLKMVISQRNTSVEVAD